MRIIIPGGSGALGRPLAHHLAAEGHQVVILSRSPAKYQAEFPEGVILEAWDGKTDGDWFQSVDGADVVINFSGENLAGEGFLPNRWTAETKRRILESRSDSGKAIVRAVEQAAHKPAALIQASAIGYYGAQGDQILTETARAGQDFLAEVCVAWEATTAPVESMGVRRVVTRIGLMMDPGSGPLARLIPQFKFFGGGTFGGGRQWWSWIHREDTLRALQFLAQHPTAAGPVNVTAPNPLSNRDFAKILGKVMGRPSFWPIPAFAMRLVMGEVADTVLHGQRVVPGQLEALGFTFQFPAAEAALRNLLKTG